MNQSNLTIDVIRGNRDKHSYVEIDPNDFFVNGLIIDVQSLNVLCLIYDALNEENKKKFNGVLQTDYKLANLVHNMWKLVK